jgi:hypothetical protein
MADVSVPAGASARPLDTPVPLDPDPHRPGTGVGVDPAPAQTPPPASGSLTAAQRARVAMLAQAGQAAPHVQAQDQPPTGLLPQPLHRSEADGAAALVDLARRAGMLDTQGARGAGAGSGVGAGSGAGAGPGAGTRPNAGESDGAALAARLHDVIQDRYRHELALLLACDRLASLVPPSRQALASEYLIAAGLDPQHRMKIPPVPSKARTLAQALPPRSAASYYFDHDALSARQVRQMSARELTDAEVAAIKATLPDSLDAEFARRFDVYLGHATARTLAVVRAALDTIAAREGRDLPLSHVEISTARLQYFRKEPVVLRGGAFLHDGQAQQEAPALGLFIDIGPAAQAAGTGTGRTRYFLCAGTGILHRIPDLHIDARAHADSRAGADASAATLETWAHSNQVMVFGEFAQLIADAKAPLLKTRVVLGRLAPAPGRPRAPGWPRGYARTSTRPAYTRAASRRRN